MIRIDTYKLGKICQRFRREQGILQAKVADDLQYSVNNVSSFENGKNDNSRIFLWYIMHGLTKAYIEKEIDMV